MKHKLKNAPPDTKRHVNYGRCLYAAFLAVTVLCGYTQPVFAATIWTKANEIMKDVYNQIILISTIAGVRNGIGCPSDDEFFQKRKNRGRITCMAQAYRHYLGDLKRAWLYHGLHHPVLLQAENGTDRRKEMPLWEYLTESWNGLPNRS